jgi:hypothetical protein
VHRTIGWRDLYRIFARRPRSRRSSCWCSALAGIFAYAVNTLGIADPVSRRQASASARLGTLILLFVVHDGARHGARRRVDLPRLPAAAVSADARSRGTRSGSACC